ncbi:DUF4113 domain-containing protein [Candidatus Uhrbacteria bacterium]|nr:DUF4113 domain-containing protein [Candidatus Uhrbacteria bacterium]
MNTYDVLNQNSAPKTVSLAAMTSRLHKPTWASRRTMASPCYTTKWNDLPRVT